MIDGVYDTKRDITIGGERIRVPAFVIKLSMAKPGADTDATDAAEPRLPPEVIQRTVREHYDEFRKCYEAGLAKNPKLAGRVTVKFVIGLDGVIESIEPAAETSIPDSATVSCVIDACKTLRFPKPSGGVVTVVYPVVFAPE